MSSLDNMTFVVPRLTRQFFCTTTQRMNLDKIITATPTHQYKQATLDVADVNKDPVQQFHSWFQQAKDAKIPIPEAVNLATAQLPSGRVSSRTVLFKELDNRGLVVYSNWGTSKKAQDVKSNPWAAVTFFWKELERQVRVEGHVEFLSSEESQPYYSSRPRDSQIGAWASPQSQEIAGREVLDSKITELENKFKDTETIPVPDFWGGVRIVPLEWEFWQGRENRVHDRVVYTRDSESEPWKVVRIAP